MHVELVVQQAVSKPRSKLFPVLAFLLMACYGIMTLVVIEQGHVIQSQRNLILQLFQDSSQLSALKSQEATQRALDKERAEAKAKTKGSHSSAQAAPQAQTSLARNPSQKALARHSQNPTSKMEKQPLQAVDKVDRRRFPSQI